ncbi:MAG: winged helix-turn-helix transcriptional regulator [Anaerolineales bacterium]|nr:winged helix-turn-helix transcriptional regulator [Anaerolineales bacterium]
MNNTPSLLEEITTLHAEVCSALGDPTRILIIYTLAESPRNVGDLAQQLGISQPTASRHLKVLRERGLVIAVRQGACVEYHLADHRLVEALDLLRGILRDRLTHRASLVDADLSIAE